MFRVGFCLGLFWVSGVGASKEIVGVSKGFCFGGISFR